MSKSALLIAVLLAAGCIAQLARAFEPGLITPVVLERMQLVVFPLLLIAGWRFRPRGFRVPSAVFAAAGVLGCAALAYAYGIASTGREYVIARLEDDGSGSVSRIFSERIAAVLSSRNIGRSGGRLYRAVSNEAEAAELVNELSDTGTLVWGSGRWVRVAFSPEPPITLGELGGELDPRFASLRLVTRVPSLGLSRAPELGTTRFLAALIEGLIRSNAGDMLRAELSLLEAGQLVETWTSFAHRAYPLFLVGTSYIQRAVREGDRPLLGCAEGVFRRAFRYLRHRDNPELYTALINNTGVLYALQGTGQGKRHALRTARKLFRRAARLKARRSTEGFEQAALVARANLTVIAADKSKRGKKGRKKRKRNALRRGR